MKLANILYLASKSDFLYLLSLRYSLFGRYVCFLSFMPTTLKLYTHAFIHNTNAYELLSDSHNYFTCDSHNFPNLENMNSFYT